VVPLLTGLQEFEAMGQYTRGPWRIGGIKDLKEGRGREIASDDARIGIVYGVTDPDVIANARLIAAAPEMLEALKMVLQHGRIDDSESRMAMVASAISKAEQ
jgi:hypothetical protein